MLLSLSAASPFLHSVEQGGPKVALSLEGCAASRMQGAKRSFPFTGEQE